MRIIGRPAPEAVITQTASKFGNRIAIFIGHHCSPSAATSPLMAALVLLRQSQMRILVRQFRI